MPTLEVEKARNAISNVQDFDAGRLLQRKRLGEDLAFDGAVEPAERIINFFQKIPTDRLDQLPDNVLYSIFDMARLVTEKFDEILKFSAANDSTPRNTRDRLVDDLKALYSQCFNNIHQYLSFLSLSSIDVSKVEQSARKRLDELFHNAGGLAEQLATDREEARRILDEVRRISAEEGLGQQAMYFREEASTHNRFAANWRWVTFFLSIFLVNAAALTVIFRNHAWLIPANNYEAINIGVGKLLLFAVLSYLISLSARNYLAHRHNAVVNKHRQNALLTFSALVDAAKGEDKRDIVLTHAAACIFSPQETGYAKGTGSQDVPVTKLIEVIPKGAPNSN